MGPKFYEDKIYLAPLNDRLFVAKFWNLLQVREFRHCWTWNGSFDAFGYGRVYYSEKGVTRAFRTHILSWLFFNGKRTPGLVTDHMCMNKACGNPQHLREVTRAINNTENSNSIAAIHKKKTHCKHGHPFSEENTAMRNQGGRLTRICLTCASNNSAKARAKYAGRKASQILGESK